MITYQVTNEDLYYTLVNDVDCDALESKGYVDAREFRGHLSIRLESGEQKEITGEFHADDYKDEFGFVIVRED